MAFSTDIGSTCIIPKGQNTVRQEESEGHFTFLCFWTHKIYFWHEGQDVLCILVCPMYVCAQTEAFTGTLMETLILFMSVAYMELHLKSCPSSFTVLLVQFLNGIGKSWGWNLSVPTGEGLQDSIMDEHILVLGGSWSLGQLITQRMLLWAYLASPL